MEMLQYDPPMATKLVVLQSCGVALEVEPCSEHQQLLHTIKHICFDIDGLSQPSTKELQYHFSIATPTELPATQIKSWQQ